MMATITDQAYSETEVRMASDTEPPNGRTARDSGATIIDSTKSAYGTTAAALSHHMRVRRRLKDADLTGLVSPMRPRKPCARRIVKPGLAYLSACRPGAETGRG